MYVTHRSFGAPAPAIRDFFWLYHTYSLLRGGFYNASSGFGLWAKTLRGQLLLRDSYTAKLRRERGNVERRLSCCFVRSLQTENLEKANDRRVQFYSDCVRREFYSYVKDLKLQLVPISCRFMKVQNFCLLHRKE